jgi:excisionase family DNA binding protein
MSTETLPARMTVKQVAAEFGKHPDTVRKACESGELFATQRIKGGRWSIRPDSVDHWLDGTPDPAREAHQRFAAAV